MPDEPDVAAPVVTPGFAPWERWRAANLFWQAFRDKLTPVLAPEDKAVAFLAAALCPNCALAARAHDGRLLGLAGIKTGRGGLLGGSLRDLAGVYGWTGAVWRGGLMSLFTRRPVPGTLLMDGIFVAEEARDRGVGTALLRAVKDEARCAGLGAVRLDVADHNARARALYERHGFTAVGVTRSWPLRRRFGIRSSTEMRCDL